MPIGTSSAGLGRSLQSLAAEPEMPSNGEELAEEMALVDREDLVPAEREILEGVLKSPEMQRLTAKLQLLHERLIESPTLSVLKQVQDCQWEIYQLSLYMFKPEQVH